MADNAALPVVQGRSDSDPSAPEGATVSFESLPIEIRKEICSLVLVKDELIRLQTIQHRWEGGADVVRVDVRYSPGHLHQIYKEGKGWTLVPHTNGILSVSKTMNAEASAVLYGQNFFSLSNAKIAHVWLKSIKKSKIYLRLVNRRSHKYLPRLA